MKKSIALFALLIQAIFVSRLHAEIYVTPLGRTSAGYFLFPRSVVNHSYFTVSVSNKEETITGVMVQRAGLSSDQIARGIWLVDAFGSDVQVLDANHRALLTTAITIQPGQSKTFVIAIEAQSGLSEYAGQVFEIDVIGIFGPNWGLGLELPILGELYTVSANTNFIGSMNVSVNSTSDTNVIAGKPSQTLGSWTVNVGSLENIWASSPRFDIYATGGDPALVSNLELWNDSGPISSGGIISLSESELGHAVVRFSGFIHCPMGVSNLHLKGSVPASAGFSKNNSLTVFTTPSLWGTGMGESYGGLFIIEPRSPVASSTRVVQIVPGDVTGGGSLTTQDIVFVREYILGIIALANWQLQLADMNGNGVVTTADIVMMRRIILGLNP